MFKRIGLFILTNLLVMVTISIVLSLLGITGYTSAAGIDYGSLMVICLVWGMGGAFISLAMSRWMAKMMLGVHVIDQQSAGEFGWVVEMVTQLSRAAQLPATPEIGIYESADVNAFATGPSKRRSLVALSTGLLRSMGREEIAGVVGHELAHIKNGDMVTMTLLQGVINAFVMFLSRAIGFLLSQAMKEEDSRIFRFFVVLVLDIVFTMLGSIVVCWFSRQREFRADAGSAQIGGRNRMIAALEALKRMHGEPAPAGSPEAAIAALQISGRSRGGFLSYFATHPDLDDRIARLKSFT